MRDLMKSVIAGMLLLEGPKNELVIQQEITRLELLECDDRPVTEVLAEMVERDGTLNWDLPEGVREGSDESGYVPLVYSIKHRRKPDGKTEKS